jgi:hypothetical protein
MARTNDINSATAQFFVNLVDNDFLDHAGPGNYGYAVFGKVTSGMDVIDQIAKVATTNRMGHQNVPAADVIITKARAKREAELAAAAGPMDDSSASSPPFSLRRCPCGDALDGPWYSAFMLDAALDASRDGRTNYHTDYRPVDLEQISPHAAVAVIASEDQLFPFHTGFDFKSIREAIRRNEAQANKRRPQHRGGSTITQQVAKNLFLWSGRSYVRKGPRSVFHAAHRTHLAEGTHPRGLSQRRAVR